MPTLKLKRSPVPFYDDLAKSEDLSDVGFVLNEPRDRKNDVSKESEAGEDHYVIVELLTSALVAERHDHCHGTLSYFNTTINLSPRSISRVVAQLFWPQSKPQN